MLKQINYYQQLMIRAVLYAICSVEFVFSLMGTINEKYAFLLELEDVNHSVINLSFLTMFLLGPFVLTNIFLIVYECCKRKVNFYINTVIVLSHLLAFCFYIMFVIFQPQIYNNGHIPAIDVFFRDYDRHTLCWNNIIYLNYEVHDANAIIDDPNCVYQDNFLKKCVGCRKEVRHGEPTVFTKHQLFIIVMVVFTFFAHCCEVYKHLIKTSPVNEKAKSFVDEEETVNYEEKMRMFNVINEGYQNRTPMNSCVQTDLLPDQSPDSGFNAPYYDFPEPIYATPNKLAIPVPPPPPMPIAPIISRLPK